MNYKRKKPKGSSCCMCHPHKHNEFKKSFNHQPRQEQAAILSDPERLDELDAIEQEKIEGLGPAEWHWTLFG